MEYIYYIITIVLTNLLFAVCSLYELLMAQQNSYNNHNHFLKFILKDFKKNYNLYLLKLALFFYLILYSEFSKFLGYIYIIVMVILTLGDIDNYKKHNKKLPLKFTKRLIRILIFDYILFILLEFVLLHNFSLITYSAYSLLFITFNSFVIILSIYLLTPIEKIIFNKYKNKAISKLNRMNDIDIIGITGSFGKTSTKMVLESILSTSKKGFYTPNSYNTPNGICLTINNESSIFNEYFICEMGAKSVGQIKELCDIVNPKYGILTSIGNAHLETFKSIENIQKTKFELIESLPKDGVGVLNKDNEYISNYKIKNDCSIIWIGIKTDADIMAKNIKYSENGTKFDIVFKDNKKSLKVETILLGEKNIYNILSAVAISKNLKISDEDIIKGIKNIKPIAHRLEVKKYNNITIIDDAFNSNPEGAKNALDVLGNMKGKKIIITPGMVEMGSKEEMLNEEFGMQISDVCDEVYLVGPIQTLPIYNGLISKKYKTENIHVCKTFNDAYNYAVNTNKNITILIENDLPDSYSEV